MWRYSLLLAAVSSLTAACERHIDAYLHQLPSRSANSRRQQPSLTENESILVQSFDNVSISDWSYYYTHGYHIAGQNKSMAQWTADRWIESSIPSSLEEYVVYLNYPESASLELVKPDGSNHKVQLFEDVLAEDETTSYPGVPPAFHGYSASGNVSAEYIYVGRGHVDDFKRLVELGISLEGKIALAKYGGPFRGLKVKNAQNYGMVGCVIFTDPGDDGVTEARGFAPYPKGPARQASSIQRGSVQFISTYPGDPTTPGIPSREGAPRSDKTAVTPRIPSLPISYRDAIPLLAALDGTGASADSVSRGGWKGGLNVAYSTGPAPGAVLHLSNQMKDVTTPIWNVIGIINGTSTDETIIIGSHRDSWSPGAADPNSGSAILVELARAFGKLKATGWSPRRNIVLASWDAEEYGLVGSTEWVEEYAPWLGKTAVTYLNVDIAVSGPFPDIAATPELQFIAQDVMKKIIYPKGATTTFWDAWQKLYQFRPEDRGFGDMGSGSDYTAFLHQGIGAIDIGAGGGKDSPIFHYHSIYDSYAWMTTFGDPGFLYHTSIGQYLTLLAYHLADDVVIPFDLEKFSDYMGYFFRDIVIMVSDGERQRKLNINDIYDANTLFKKNAQAMTNLKAQADFAKNETLVAIVNAKQRDFQRAFVSQGGLPGREFYKHVAWAPGLDTGYAAVTFPGIKEALWANNDELAAEWVKKTASAIRAAANVLAM